MKVRELLLSEAKSDLQRLDRILKFLDGSRVIDNDTVEWLSRGIHGHYGGEGYVLNISFAEEAAFWYALHQKCPDHARLNFVAADAAYLANWPNALEIFFQAFELDSSLIYGLEGSVWQQIQQSDFRLKFALILLKDSVREGDQQDLDELLEELRADFAGDLHALQLIEAAAR